MTEPLTPPPARKIAREITVHGRTLRDDYFWLHQRTDEEVIQYLKAENAYTDSVLKPVEGLQEKIYRELVGRIKETDLSVPVKRDDYYYYSRTEKGLQYPIYCRKRGSLEAAEVVILDMNELARGFSYFSLGILSISPDHRFLAYSTDTRGAEVYTISIKDLESGKLLGETIHDTATSAEWAEDNKTLFYTRLDAAKRPYKLFRHRLGEDPAGDAEIFHEKDESFFLSISKTRDRRFLLLDLSSKTTSEEHILDAQRPENSFRVIEPRRQGVEYYAEHHDSRFFIVTNENARNFKLVEAPDANPGRSQWKDYIPHRPDVKIDDIAAFRDHLVLFERETGLTHIRVRHLPSGEEHRIAFPEPVYTAWPGNNPEFDSELLRFGYSSLVTPASVFDYNMRTRERELKKQQEVLGGYDPSLYASERILVESHDGVKVPVSLVYRRGMERNGANPLFLYGYGSYGISIDPSFSSNRLSLLDRGFIFAIAHIRGGGELGRPWYEDGKLMKKKNTFLDFIACADYLVNEKYTAPDRMVISGGSAGGLLMGAVVNARPDLFRAVVMHVPFVDIVNTMLDRTLPLTVTEYEEWGNPEADREAFEYIHSYSPYDNIRSQKYPHILVVSGLNDPRVQYWEPAKWTAKLREMKRDDNYLLLKMNMGAGHGGASGRYDYLREIALDYSFILLALEMTGR